MSTELDHERWEELAAGYALNALEPAEGEEFTAHLSGCERCVSVLADHSFVAAQLGSLVEDLDAAPSWESVRGALPTRSLRPLPDLRPRQPFEQAPAAVVPLESRRRRFAPLLAAAASLVVLGSAGTLAWQAQSDDKVTQQEAMLARCASTPSCHVVQLQSQAKVVVLAGEAHLMAENLPAVSSSQRYVLWQMPRTGRPTMVGMLQETGNGSIGEGHELALPYEETAAFGLSVEKSLALPDGPTHVVAVGTA